jgi:hypothetical protein
MIKNSQNKNMLEQPIKYMYLNQMLSASEISKLSGIPQTLLESRLKKGWDIQQAIEAPYTPF